MEWKIFYSDKRTIDSTQKDPFELDGDKERAGIQVIIQPAEDPRDSWVTASGDDYFVWDNIGDRHKWVGVDFVGLLLYLLKSGPKCVLFGEITTNERFKEIWDSAVKEIGEKHSFIPGERHP